MEQLLDFLTKPDGAALFMLLVVPGFISVRTLESRIARERLKAAEALIDIVVFSAANGGLWAVILHFFGVDDLQRLPQWGVAALLFVMVIISPIVLALVYEAIWKRISGPGNAGVIHPTAKPWDWLFKEHIQTPKQIVFTLSDGRRFGGIWQDPSFASSFPAEEQIFISEVYNVDQTSGQLIDKIPYHDGILVDKSTIDVVEVFDTARPFAKRSQPGP